MKTQLSSPRRRGSGKKDSKIKAFDVKCDVGKFFKATPKISLIPFFLTGIIFLLQLFPVTGIFLMMTGGMFWSIATLNAGFLFLFLESLSGFCSRVFLIIPIAYFGGYTCLTIASHLAYENLKSEIASQNSSVHIAFDPNKNDLVIPDESFSNLVYVYNLPIIYLGEKGSPRENYRAIVLSKQDACGVGAMKVVEYGFSSMPIYENKEKSRFRMARTDVCFFKYYKQPEKPEFKVSYTEERKKNWLLPVDKQTITVTTPTQETYTLIGGRASPYSWFPKPVIGCALNDNPSAWECFAGFIHDEFQSLTKSNSGQKGDAAALADALGLKYRAPDDVHAEDIANIDLEEIKKHAPSQIERKNAKDFHEFLTNPVDYRGNLGFYAFDNPYFFTSKKLEITQALEKLKSIPTDDKKYARRLISTKIEVLTELLEKSSENLEPTKKE